MRSSISPGIQIYEWVAFGTVLAGTERLSGSSAVKIIATSSISLRLPKYLTLYSIPFLEYSSLESLRGEKEKKKIMWESPPSSVNMTE